MAKKQIPEDRLIELQNKISLFSARSLDKKNIIRDFADLYGVSTNTVYRSLRDIRKPRPIRRSDVGNPRKLNKKDLEKYCSVIAALKVRSMNKKGHHLSTAEAIRLLEYGVESPEGIIKIPMGILTKSTVNHYLKLWGYNLTALSIEPVSTRFQAKYSNECWHFDLSPSDLKSLEEWPGWIKQKEGRPILMLFSVVDDRSGVAFQRYEVVYGEDAESALRFLFLAMSAKDINGFPFHGIPDMIYMDNGPIAKSAVFQRVMQYLGVNVRCHMPKGQDGRRTTVRAKGKVERPFRTTKEVHETLYHFHKPKNVEEANEWLQNYVLRYNEKQHRFEPHSRIDDWIKNVSPSGIKEMCSWNRFCTFAREPERRKVGPDAMIKVNGINYDVSHELADQEVIIWRGLFDNELFIELGEKRYGPYQPSNGPIALNRFRTYKKTTAENRADSIEKLAQQINIPISVLTEDTRPIESLLKKLPEDIAIRTFEDPDPFQQKYYPNTIAAKVAISELLGIPLAKLSAEERQLIDQKLAETLEKSVVIDMVKTHFIKRPTLRVIKGKRANDL